jgi:hypothetical protein
MLAIMWMSLLHTILITLNQTYPIGLEPAEGTTCPASQGAFNYPPARQSRAVFVLQPRCLVSLGHLSDRINDRALMLPSSHQLEKSAINCQFEVSGAAPKLDKLSHKVPNVSQFGVRQDTLVS